MHVAGAAAVVARMDRELVVLGALAAQPQVARPGVAHSIGDDFLRTAQQHLRTQRIVDGKPRRQFQMDIEARHPLDQRLERLRQVDVVVFAQLADDFAHVGQQ